MTSDDEINIAIAEDQGWIWYRLPKSRGERLYRALFLPELHEIDQLPEWTVRADGTERMCNMAYMHKDGAVPKYTEDLNEIMPVICRISLGNREQYYSLLCQVTQRNRMATCAWTTITAKAIQHCEAYLKLKRKWKT